VASGWNGKLLRVNLTRSQWQMQPLEDAFRRTYLGGWGMIAYTLLHEVPPHADPLGPENRLIFANGTVSGAAVGGSGRSAVGGKSPLTGGFGEADVGGYWLRRAWMLSSLKDRLPSLFISGSRMGRWKSARRDTFGECSLLEPRPLFTKSWETTGCAWPKSARPASG